MKPHYTDKRLTIHKITCGPYGNNAYIVVCNKTNESLLIDTPAEPAVLLAVASTTQVQYIAITHNHMDHLLGFEEITKAIPAKVAIGEADANQLPASPDLSLSDGKDIQIGDLLSVEPLEMTDWLIVFATASTVFFFDEARKLIQRSQRSERNR